MVTQSWLQGLTRTEVKDELLGTAISYLSKHLLPETVLQEQLQLQAHQARREGEVKGIALHQRSIATCSNGLLTKLPC